MKDMRTWIVGLGAIALLGGLGAGIAAADGSGRSTPAPAGPSASVDDKAGPGTGRGSDD